MVGDGLLLDGPGAVDGDVLVAHRLLAGLVPALEGVDGGHVAVGVAGLDLVARLVVALDDREGLVLDVGVPVDGLGRLRVDRVLLALDEVGVGVGEVPQVGHGVPLCGIFHKINGDRCPSRNVIERPPALGNLFNIKNRVIDTFTARWAFRVGGNDPDHVARRHVMDIEVEVRTVQLVVFEYNFVNIINRPVVKTFSLALPFRRRHIGLSVYRHALLRDSNSNFISTIEGPLPLSI